MLYISLHDTPNNMGLYFCCRIAVIEEQHRDFGDADLLDVVQNEFLCPVCRRLGTALLPALAPKPLSSPKLPSQAKELSPVLPNEATQQQAGPAGMQAIILEQKPESSE